MGAGRALRTMHTLTTNAVMFIFAALATVAVADPIPEYEFGDSSLELIAAHITKPVKKNTLGWQAKQRSAAYAREKAADISDREVREKSDEKTRKEEAKDIERDCKDRIRTVQAWRKHKES